MSCLSILVYNREYIQTWKYFIVKTVQFSHRKIVLLWDIFIQNTFLLHSG